MCLSFRLVRSSSATRRGENLSYLTEKDSRPPESIRNCGNDRKVLNSRNNNLGFYLLVHDPLKYLLDSLEDLRLNITIAGNDVP